MVCHLCVCECNNCNIFLFIIVVCLLAPFMISVDPSDLCLPRQRWSRFHFWSLIWVMNYSKEIIQILKSFSSDRGIGFNMWEENSTHICHETELRALQHLPPRPPAHFILECVAHFCLRTAGLAFILGHVTQKCLFYCNWCSTLHTIIMYFLSSSSWFIFRLPVLTEVACSGTGCSAFL